MYSENRNNRARIIIFDIGWGPGCGVGGPGGGFFNVNSFSGLPLLLFPLKPPTNTTTRTPAHVENYDPSAIIPIFRVGPQT